MKTKFTFQALFAGAALFALTAVAQTVVDPPADRADALIDLKTNEGMALVKGQWRFHDATTTAVPFRAPGADLRPSGEPITTMDITPKAGVAGFDDSGWEKIAADSLEQRRTTGEVSFAWYRARLTIPEKVAEFSTAGSTVVFELVIDDYAEIWVNGKLPRVLGQVGGNLVKGFNAPNRVILTRNARPGETFELAVFGINGPISASPQNFIWIRSATLDFYRAPRRIIESVPVNVTRVDQAVDELIPRDAKIEKLAGGFLFTEGPVWVPRTEENDGYLLFSDPNANTIYRYSTDGQVSVFRPKSGFSGMNIGEYRQPGSNGLTLDREGRLTINQHGNRRVIRIEKTGATTVLADGYQGKRLNSPNDLVYKSDGALYFTDPPFGLPKVYDDPRKDLPHTGVYRLSPDGRELTLLSTDLRGPNGIAFSPDEKFLYVANWDVERKIVMRYPVLPDGLLGKGEVFFDVNKAEAIPSEDALDGIKSDVRGNLYLAGPGGIWIISPGGKHLATLVTPEHAANATFGGDDGRDLYITASNGLYRLRVSVPGIGPGVNARATEMMSRR